MGYCKPLPSRIQRGQRFGANPGWGPNPPGGHNGDDYLSQIGEPIYAAGDGEVIHAGQFDSTYADNFGWNLNYGGNMVVLNLDGEGGPYVEYGHMDKIYVQAGQRVARGQVIGTTGATDGGTGVITGPHLHVGILPPNFNLNTNTYGRVNPDLYLTDYPDEAGTISAQSATITPAPQAAPVEQPKEWDEMASKEDIGLVTWGGPGGTMIHNYRLGRGEYPQTILGALEGRMQNEILPAVIAPLQQQIGSMSAKIDALATALAAKPDSPLTKEEALAQLDASVKASFGEYTPVLVKSETVPVEAAQ